MAPSIPQRPPPRMTVAQALAGWWDLAPHFAVAAGTQALAEGGFAGDAPPAPPVGRGTTRFLDKRALDRAWQAWQRALRRCGTPLCLQCASLDGARSTRGEGPAHVERLAALAPYVLPSYQRALFAAWDGAGVRDSDGDPVDLLELLCAADLPLAVGVAAQVMSAAIPGPLRAAPAARALVEQARAWSAGRASRVALDRACVEVARVQRARMDAPGWYAPRREGTARYAAESALSAADYLCAALTRRWSMVGVVQWTASAMTRTGSNERANAYPRLADLVRAAVACPELVP